MVKSNGGQVTARRAPETVPARRGALRAAAAVAVAGSALLLGGCVTGPRELPVSVASWGDWPAARKPSTFAFERLPSQQDRADQAALEDAARGALARAGFREAAAGVAPDATVQVGARVSRAALSPWDDPVWWPGGFGVWRHSPWRGVGWGMSATWPPTPRYDREVAILIRDRESGKPLYEARASSEGYSSMPTGLLPALYDAALKDFPATGLNPRIVRVPLAG